MSWNITVGKKALRSGAVCGPAALMFSLTVLVPGKAAAQTPREVVTTLVGHEQYAAAHKNRFTYLSNEHSDRTDGHVWTERVVETSVGRVRRLLAVDGSVLSEVKVAAENARLQRIAANPSDFVRHEAAVKDDEQHALAMLELLPKAFVVENMRQQGQDLRLDFRPNPDYAPQSLEERVLHAMSGFMLLDEKTIRMHHIEGKLPEDVNIGFGFLATIHAGSSFMTDKAQPSPGEWKTQRVDSDIRGKAAFFKAISKNQHVVRTEFQRVPSDLTVTQAVELAMK